MRETIKIIPRFNIWIKIQKVEGNVMIYASETTQGCKHTKRIQFKKLDNLIGKPYSHELQNCTGTLPRE